MWYSILILKHSDYLIAMLILMTIGLSSTIKGYSQNVIDIDSVGVYYVPDTLYPTISPGLIELEKDGLIFFNPFSEKIHRFNFDLSVQESLIAPGLWMWSKKTCTPSEGNVSINGRAVMLLYNGMQDSRGKSYDYLDIRTPGPVLYCDLLPEADPYFDPNTKRLYATLDRRDGVNNKNGFLGAFTWQDSVFVHDTTFVRHDFGEDYILPPALSVTTLDTLILVQLAYEPFIRTYHTKTFERLENRCLLPANIQSQYYKIKEPLHEAKNNIRTRMAYGYYSAQIYTDTLNQRLIRVLRAPIKVEDIYKLKLTNADSLFMFRFYGDSDLKGDRYILAQEQAAIERKPYLVQVYDYDLNFIREFESPVPFSLVGNVGRSYYSYGSHDGKKYWLYKWTWPEEYYSVEDAEE